MPTSSTQRPTWAADSSRFTPSVSTTSAEPQSDAAVRPDIERLPCLATLRPAPATTNAVAVEMLNVPEASPPVPQVSTSISRSVPVRPATSSARVRTRATLLRMTWAKPISSSTVSPFMRKAVKNAAICALVATPDMIASMAADASMRVRSRRSTSVRTASVMMGLVIAQMVPLTPWGPRNGPQTPRLSGHRGAAAVPLSTARAREHELLERGFPGPDGDGLAAQHLDHRGDRVRIVAQLVEDDGPAVLHEPRGEMRLAKRVHDRL